MKRHTASATDTNHKPLGRIGLLVETDADGHPIQVEYKGVTFFPTHKIGTNFASGKTVHELSNTDGNTDQRIWVSNDLSDVYED